MDNLAAFISAQMGGALAKEFLLLVGFVVIHQVRGLLYRRLARDT